MGKTTLLLGTRKGLLFFQREASGWKVTRRAHLGTPIAYACHDARNGVTWACLDHGHWGQKLSRSRDGGETWEDAPSPGYPDGCEILEGFPGTENRAARPARLRYNWVIQPAHADQPKRLYVGTEPGGLFRSDDGGNSWELVRSLWDMPGRRDFWFGGGRDHPGIHSVIVDPRDSRRILVGVSCAGVIESTDDGATWAYRCKGMLADFMPDPTSEIGQDPHFVDFCLAQPDVMWTQHHCGIFRTVDGGKQWEPASRKGDTVHFGFAVAADPVDPLTAWVVPATSDENRIAPRDALCVGRTTDGGLSWEELRAGLPQRDAYDLTFRHALALCGDILAFGTTSGNVFLSEDRGDTWACLGNYFPQVYSARFAVL